MNDIPVNPNNTIETNDSLEAVGVFRAWKNIFFIIVLVCLLLTQVAFWSVDLGLIEVPKRVSPSIDDTTEPVTQTEPAPRGFIGGLVGELNFETLARVIGVGNGILIVSGILFAMTIFFCVMVSLVGRLGGINHISRAFILSLIMVALIIPWQRLFGSNVVGAAYVADELVSWVQAKAEGMPNVVFYYLRFTGLWLVVLLLLIMSQLRSARWSKSILRRLEII